MMKTIGNYIILERLKKRLSREELCNRVYNNGGNLSKSYLSLIERGKKNNISTCVLVDICKVLNVTPNDLIPEELYKGDTNDTKRITRGDDS